MATKVVHPAKVMTGYPATFGCHTDVLQPYKYHWSKNGKIIGGSHSAASYTTHPLQSADLGSKYSVTVYGRDGSVETSAEVELSAEPPVEEVAVVEVVEPELVPEAEESKAEESTDGLGNLQS